MYFGRSGDLLNRDSTPTNGNIQEYSSLSDPSCSSVECFFGYYVVAPLSVNFLGGYTLIEGNDIQANPTISSYIALLRSVVIACGLIFELPVIIYFLTKLGLVTPQFLRKYRRHALVIVLIVSAIITPPDIASQVIVAVPVVILYQISILISKVVIKRQNKKAKANAR